MFLYILITGDRWLELEFTSGEEEEENDNEEEEEEECEITTMADNNNIYNVTTGAIPSMPTSDEEANVNNEYIINAMSTVTITEDNNSNTTTVVAAVGGGDRALPPLTNDSLYFNDKHGSLIKLSGRKQTAERMHAMDEFNNGVVMTNRPLRNNEMFEVSKERVVRDNV